MLAAEVRTAATSGVGSGVVEGPQATSKTVMIRIVKMSFSFMLHPIFGRLDYGFFTSKDTVRSVPK